MKKNLMEKVDKIDLQVSEINLNLLGKIDQIDLQEMERKKVLVLKGNQVLQKKNNIKPSGFTNNPKYFGKKPSENSSTEDEKKSFGFKGKKKFKSRNSRPKNFSFKKHSKKRIKS